ncbi:MAG: NUDIX domain-containing protein, partial [Alicyclobacillus sp.]|nr:NUDIX domain-containing protein [Alicyclobacillus sp.]
IPMWWTLPSSTRISKATRTSTCRDFDQFGGKGRDAVTGTMSATRPAAAVLLLRDAPGAASGVQVLVLQRGRQMRFLPGYLAFPGGSVEAADERVALQFRTGTLCASAHSDDDTFAVAALRECAEEIGWLCACRPRVGERTGSHASALSLDASQQADLLEPSGSFADLLDRLQLQLDLGRMRFVGRWITPPQMPVRFDTRFFATDGSAIGEVRRVNRAEVDWAAWHDPAELLARIGRGEALSLPPTRAMLAALASTPNVATALMTLSVPGPSPQP